MEMCYRPSQKLASELQAAVIAKVAKESGNDRFDHCRKDKCRNMQVHFQE